MYLLEKHIEYRCALIKIAPYLEKGVDYKTLERDILQIFIKNSDKLDYIFDFTRSKRISDNERTDLKRLINYFPLKAPETVLLIGEKAITDNILKMFFSLSKKEGTRVLRAETYQEAELIAKKDGNLNLIKDLFQNLRNPVSGNKDDKEVLLVTEEDTSRDFAPKKRIELQFNSGERNQYTREVKIFQYNNEKKLILTSQTIPPCETIPEGFIKITTLVRKSTGTMSRVEYRCKIKKIFKNVKIRNTVIKDALLLQFLEPRKEVNYRNSYRYRLKSNYKVESIITFSGKKYFSNMHYDIDDISISGVGLKVAKSSNGEIGFKANVGDSATIEATLIEPGKFNSSKKTKIESSIEVVRRSNLSGKEDLVGIRFCDINKKDEMYINRFISNAQSYELRKKHRSI